MTDLTVTWRRPVRRRALASLLAGAVLGVTLLVVGGATPAGAHSPHDAIGDVEVSPRFAEDGTVYSIVREYLIKSVDGGSTWTRLNRGLDNRHNLSAIEVSAQDPAVLYTSTRGDGVYRSDDAGASWEKANTGLGQATNVPQLFLSPGDDQVLFAVTQEGTTWRTESGGDGWEEVPGLAGEAVSTIGFAPDDPDIVWVATDGALRSSTDGGETWEEHPLEDEAHVDAIALSPDYTSDGTLFVGTAEDGVLRSVDSGTRFTDASRGISDKRVQDLQISPGYAEDGEVLASTWLDGVFRTSNRGDSWQRHSEGLTTDEQADLLERPHFTALVEALPAPDAEPVIFLAGFNGLFRTEDDADSWEELRTQDSTNIAAVALSPTYAEDGTLFVGSYLNGAFRSEDQGETWTAINDGLAFEYDYLREDDYLTRLTTLTVSPDFATDDTVWASVRGYLFDSEDAGAEWHAATPPALVGDGFPPDYLIPAFSPDFSRDRTMFAGTDSGQFLRWEAGEPPEAISSVDAEIVSVGISPGLSEDGTILLATVDGIERSTDEGVTWAAVDGTPKGATGMALSPAFDEDGTAFLGTKSNLLMTSDGGVTWKPVTDPALGENPYIEAVVPAPTFADDGMVLVTVRGRGLFRTTDGGATFAPWGQDLLDDDVVLASFYHPTSEPIVFSPDFAEDQTVFGIAQDGLYRSTDAGESWSELEVPRTTHPLTRESAPNELLVIPRNAEEAAALAPEADGGGGITATARAQADHTILTLSVKRVLVALAAAVVAFALLWAAKVGSRTSKERLAIVARVAGAGLVFAVALFFLSNR